MKINFTNVFFFSKKVLIDSTIKYKFLTFIMRTSIFLFYTTVFSLSSGSTLSQNAKIVIDSDRILTVDQVFDIIKQQTDYTFIYRSDLFKNAPKIHIKKGTIRTNKLLKESLSFGDFSYFLSDDGTITLEKRIENIAQESFLIKGNVSDEKGNPIQGVIIFTTREKPNDAKAITTITGTETDSNGNYSLTVFENEYLLIRSVGFISIVEQIIKSKLVYNFTLREDLNILDEVVLTGYTKTNKTVSTMSASKITKKSIGRQATTNLDDRLEGLVTGLTLNTVTPDGGEAGLELIVRGISSFNQTGSAGDPVIQARNSLNRQPLIVVDGFPYEGPFNDIDSETVETIDVLKDAAASAIWGNRASNGVIVITTKRGQTGDTEIKFNSYFTLGTGQNIDDLQLASSSATIDVLSAEQKLEGNSFLNRLRYISNVTRANRFHTVNAFEDIWILFYRGIITESERDSKLNDLGQIDNHNEFKKHLLRNGAINKKSLSIRGGSEAIKYSFITTHLYEERPDVGDDFERLNISLTTDLKFTNKFSATVDVALSNSIKKNNGIGMSVLYTGGTTSIRRFSKLVDDNGNPLPIIFVNSEDRNDFYALGFDDASYNPITDQKLRDNSIKTFNLRLAGGLKYKLFDWLTADFKYQHNRITRLTRNDKRVNLFSTRTDNNSYVISPDAGSGVERAVPYGGSLERNESNTINNVYRGSLYFNKTIQENHNVSALAGMEVSESTFTNNKQHFIGYNDSTGLYNTIFNHNSFIGSFNRIPDTYLRQGTFRDKNYFSAGVITRNISSFGNISYNFKKKYNFNISGKINQATSFGIKKRLSKPLLWGAGASWNISKENFFKSNILNKLKIRVSYGSNGNIRPGLTSVSTIRLAGSDWLNYRPYAYIFSAGNKQLTFEKTISKNIGVDFNLLNNISGQIDYYDKQSVNLMTPDNSNSTFGQESIILSNGGEISNKGFEIQFSAKIVNTDNFSWNTNVNFSHNTNKVIKFGYTPTLKADIYHILYSQQLTKRLGEPVSSKVRYQWGGLDAEGNPQIYDGKGNTIGYKKFIANKPDSDALQSTKPFIAPTYGGVTNIINYRNFTLSFLMTYKFGHVFEEALDKKYAYPLLGGGFSHAFHKDIENAWANPGDENFTNIPATPRTVGSFSNGYIGENRAERRAIFQYSNLGIHDASHIRLRDITFGYKLGSKKWLKYTGIDNANLTLQLRNLGLLWSANNKGIDPESVPLSGRAITFDTNFPRAYRPGIKVPISIVIAAKFNF